MNAYLDGEEIRDERDFHNHIASALDFSQYYGGNLDALWDFLGDTPRPVTLTWKNSATARERLGERFEAIVRILRNAEAEDRAKPPEKRFVLVLA